MATPWETNNHHDRSPEGAKRQRFGVAPLQGWDNIWDGTHGVAMGYHIWPRWGHRSGPSLAHPLGHGMGRGASNLWLRETRDEGVPETITQGFRQAPKGRQVIAHGNAMGNEQPS